MPMNINVDISDCTTPEAIPVLMTLYYYYISILWKKTLRKRFGYSGITLHVVADNEWTNGPTTGASGIHLHMATERDGNTPMIMPPKGRPSPEKGGYPRIGLPEGRAILPSPQKILNNELNYYEWPGVWKFFTRVRFPMAPWWHLSPSFYKIKLAVKKWVSY